MITTFLFTDIEGSTRLWETMPERMQAALAAHDALAREAVGRHGGRLVKMTGDGVHAAFAEPLDAVCAALQLQKALADPAATRGMELGVRCGLHAGAGEPRDGDYFGPDVNRAARIMAAAHGGQVLLSQALAERVADRLPDGASLRDLGTARLRDLSSPVRLYQLVHPHLRGEFPALRSLEATPNNLPQQVTAFIGRELEMSEARALFAATRLLTLTGAGGLGKTRLAVQLAAELLDGFPDGAWLVELAPVGDGALVGQTVAAVLGVREVPGATVLEALVRHLRDRRLLLLLDNCEHLLQACAELAAALLRAGAQVKLLATSREPLHVAGETVHLLPTLEVPEASADPERSAAGRLFAERARAAQPSFRVTPKNAPAVAAICRQLDGIPLALELAAARIRVLPVEGIAARIGDRFALLTRGDRSALPRQQSLRATLDWSHELLTETERALLRRLSVFSGGWNLEAAEAVCAGDGVKADEVLELMAHLVDKSLVVRDATGERYDLLETVRQYAHEKLETAGEKRTTRGRHLQCYLDLAERGRPLLAGAGQGAWLARLDAERQNVLAAHRWCDRDSQGATAGYRLLHAVKPYWFIRGHLALGLRLSEEALARPGAQSRDALRRQGLFSAGQICSFMGRYAEARRYLAEALAVAREIGDGRAEASVLQPLSIALLGDGDSVQAAQCAEQALALARRTGDQRELMGAINCVGQVRQAQGAFTAAGQQYAQVVTLARTLGDYESLAVGLLNLAMVAICQGTKAEVREWLLEAHRVAIEIDARPIGQSLLEVCCGLAAADGAWRAAALWYGAADAQAIRSGQSRSPADAAFLESGRRRAGEALDSATFAESERLGRDLDYGEALTGARDWLRGGELLNR